MINLGQGEPMAEKKFEKAMSELEEIVHALESGDLPLDEALKAFEKGMKLAKFCSDKLEEAEKKVTMLVRGEDGQIDQVPFEIQKEDGE
jgi:exodeoxyribonuclease VII small subunit